MKINNYKHNNNLFKLKLIKNKIYSKNFLLIKNSLKIIYSYIKINKKILFIGSFNKINFFYKILLNNNNISYISENMIQNGFFSNIYVFKNFCLKKKKDIFKFLFNCKTLNFDLIVIFDKQKNNEILKLNKTPSIFLYNSKQNKLSNSNLNIVKLIEKDNDIFYFLIYHIFDKYKK